MDHYKNLALLLLLYSILHFPRSLIAASSPNKTGDADKPPLEPSHQTVSSGTENTSTISGDDKVGVKLPVVHETCDSASKKCHHDALNVTACIFPNTGDGPMALLVLNEGDGSLKFNVTTPPSEPTSNYIEIAAHKVKKMNLSADVSSATSVVLKADSWTCTIQLQLPLPDHLPQPPPPPSPSPPPPPPPLPPSPSFPTYSYVAYATPVNGVYLLLATSLLIGLIWGSCKLRKKTRNGEVPYQQLEMGKEMHESTSSIDVETGGGGGGGGGGWDQDWDDDWDEEKAVRSPGGNHIENGGSRSVESNGWEDDWKI